MSETRVVDMGDCPFQQFLLHMDRTDSNEWVWSYIEVCSRYGVFHSSKETCILMRPVNSEIKLDDLLAFNDLDPDHELASSDLTHQHDAWHILYASGDITTFFEQAPYELPKIMWQRQDGAGPLKINDFHRVKNLSHV